MTSKTASVNQASVSLVPPRTFPLQAGGMTFGVRLPRRMTARKYEARYRDEAKWLRRYYCTLFAFWKSCRFKPCRKARACAGDAQTCLKRNDGFVSREKQFAARQRLLDLTPAHIGAPERLARQAMPDGLVG